MKLSSFVLSVTALFLSVQAQAVTKVKKSTVSAATSPEVVAETTEDASASKNHQETAAPLANELKTLELPASANSVAQNEQVYSVQSRLYPLRYGFTLSGGGAKNFNTNGLVSSQEAFANLRFYFNDRIFTSFYGSQVNNRLTGAGERLKEEEELVPDVVYINRRADAMIGANLFYGKFRFSMDKTFYFDHYVALGGGFVDQTNGTETRARAAVGETGFAFWFGRANVTLGVKDYYFEEQRRLTTGRVHHILGFTSVGVLLGGWNA